MTIAYLSTVFILHFSNLADELFKLTQGKFWFIEISPISSENLIKLPSEYDLYQKPYLIQSWKSDELKNRAIEIIKNVDVLLISGGYDAKEYEKIRLKTNKLTFEPTERQLKRGILNAFSKTSISYADLYYHIGHKNLYKLCLSAFTANDMYFLHPFFKGRCFKFGYFTQVPNINIDEVIAKRRIHSKIQLLWAARLIPLKRADLPIKMAKRLKDLGYEFNLNLIGDGELKDKLQQLINAYNLNAEVKLLGLKTNEQVYELMKDHDIFLFTSTKREGWGAVLNEAMSCGCACVSSDLIGSTPYLIDDGINGFSFKTGSLNDFTEKVIYLIQNTNLRENIQKAAYLTMTQVWNPCVAARNFYDLAYGLLSNKPIIIKDGPCSLALPIKGKTFSK